MTIRIATPEDAAAIAAIYAPIVLDTAITFDETPPSAADMAGRIATTLDTYPWLVAETNGAVAGYAYASIHNKRAAYRWSCDITVYIDAAHRRTGAGRQLYGHLFATLIRLGYVTAYAGITLPNAASIGLHEQLGFEYIGTYRTVGFKHGRWHDVGWWGKALQTPQTPPPEPLPFDAHRHLFGP